MNILATICARGGSTGIPGKNIMDIAGKPLIAWSIEHGLSDERITDLIVSTDDTEIVKVAESYGAQVPFIRPDDLATSAAGKFGVWKHALAECEQIYDKTYDYFLDIDCTTPLLTSMDLTGIIDAFLACNKNTDGMFTVVAAHRNPYFNLVEEDENGFVYLSKTLPDKVEARQAAPKAWDIVAGYYIFKADYVRNGDYLFNGNLRPYEVPRQRSFDIDEPFDAEFVDWLMRKEHK